MHKFGECKNTPWIPAAATRPAKCPPSAFRAPCSWHVSRQFSETHCSNMQCNQQKKYTIRNVRPPPPLLRTSLHDIYLRQWGYVITVVCLFVSNIVQKLPNGFALNFQGRLAMGKFLLFQSTALHNFKQYGMTLLLYNYSAKKLKLCRVLQTLCGMFEQCSRVRL